MKKLGAWMAAGMVAAGFLACQRTDDTTAKKLDEIIARLDAMDKKMAAGGAPGAARPSAQQRPSGPDPSAVFAVNVDGAPTVGPATAKVTIVEAFDFA